MIREPNIRLLVLHLDEADRRWEAHWEKALDRTEIDRANRFHHASDRTRHVAAHALLRTRLARLAGLRPYELKLERGPHGKPHLRNRAEFQFSLTHTAGLVACAFAETPLGCDAELVSRDIDAEIFRMLAPTERKWLEALPRGSERDIGFLKLWVGKEAVAKALGLGMTLELSSYSLVPANDGLRVRDLPRSLGDAGDWRISLPDAGPLHVLALAIRNEGKNAKLVVENFSPRSLALAAAAQSR